MNPPPPMEKAVFLAIVAFSVVAGLGGYLAWRSRRALRKPPAPKPAGRAPAYYRLTMIVFVALVVLTLAKGNGPEGPGRRAGFVVGMLVGSMALMLVGTVVVGLVRLDRFPQRVARLIAAEKFDEARELIEAEIAKHPAAPGPSPPSVEADPWAPPRNSTVARPDVKRATRLNLMGIMEGMRGDWAGSLEYHRQAERANASNPVGRFNQGLALTHLGREEEGLEIARKALLAMAEIQSVDRADLGAGLATRLVELGRLGAARRLLGAADGWAAAAWVIPKSAKKPLLDRLLAARAKLEAAESAESIELG